MRALTGECPWVLQKVLENCPPVAKTEMGEMVVMTVVQVPHCTPEP